MGNAELHGKVAAAIDANWNAQIAWLLTLATFIAEWCGMRAA